MSHVAKFLKRMERANNPKDPMPYDRVIPSNHFLVDLAAEVEAITIAAIILHDERTKPLE